MNFLEAIVSAVFVMLVVFTVLACLYFLIKIFSFGIRKFESVSRKTE